MYDDGPLKGRDKANSHFLLRIAVSCGPSRGKHILYSTSILILGSLPYRIGYIIENAENRKFAIHA